MSELTPITRIESYLDAIVNSGIPPTEDITRIETFLQAIYDNVVCELTPITRIEMFLGKISGQDIVLPEPITRIELYLAAIAGEDVELPENPITRLEMYLAEWADSGDWTTISGAIVEFITQRAHKLKSCVVSLSPQQDLHGYDSPWPAGGGKNKIPYPYHTQGGTIDGVTWTIGADGKVTGSGTTTRGTNFFFTRTLELKAGTYTISITGTHIGMNLIVWDNTADIPKVTKPSGDSSPSTFTLTADSVVWIYFNVGYADVAVDISAYVQLEEGSTVTAYAPYSNICPISGHTGVDVNVAGHNVWDEEWELGGLNATTGEKEDSNLRMRSKNFIPVKPGASYYFAVGISYSSWFILCGYDANKNFTVLVRSGTWNETVSIPNNVCYVRFCTSDLWNGETYAGGISINYPATDTDYHAYSGDSVSVTFPSVNIWDEEWESGYYDIVDGSAKGSPSWIRSKNDIHCAPNTSYRARQAESGGTLGYLLFYKANGDYISSQALITSVSSIGQVFTTPNECQIIKLYNGSFNIGIGFSINYPSFETGYHAHTEPMTVYGGSDEIVNGEGYITMAEVDMGDLTWVGPDENSIFYAIINNMFAPAETADRKKGIASDIYKVSDISSISQNMSDKSMLRYLGRIWVRDTSYLTAEAFTASVDGHQLVYELATPTKTAITPTPITALKGYNAMWSDGGDIEVTVHGTSVEVETLQALNMLLGGAYHNDGTEDDVSDEEALDIILGGEQR